MTVLFRLSCQEADLLVDLAHSLFRLVGSALGTGGMVTKLRAAGMCMKAGCDMIISFSEDAANVPESIRKYQI